MTTKNKHIDRLAYVAAAISFTIGVMLLLDGLGCYELGALTRYTLIATQGGAVLYILTAAP